MVKERIWFIDYAKIIGLWMVILAHLYSSEGYDSSNVIRTYIYGFHMPFFFAVSGMLYKQRPQGLKYALFKNIKSLFIPWLVFNLIFIIIEIITTNKGFINIVNTFFTCIFKGKDTYCQASWFVICLFYIKCIFDVFKYTNKMIFAYIIIALTFYSKFKYFYFASATIGFTFYYLGYVSFEYLKKISRLDLNKWLFAITAIVSFIISYYLTQINGKVSVYAASLKNPFIFYANSIIGSLGIIAFALLLNKQASNFTAKLSTASIGVVLTHVAIVKKVRIFRSNFQLDYIELFVWYSIAACCIYIICYYIYVIINKYTPWVFGRR